MATTTFRPDKATGPSEGEISEDFEEGSSSSADEGSDSDSDTSSESDFGSDSEEGVTQEFLDSLLDLARRNAQSRSTKGKEKVAFQEEEIIQLDKDDVKEQPLPSLDPGSLPTPYIELGKKRGGRPAKVRDLDVEQMEKTSGSASAPALPPSALPAGKPLTKKEKKAAKTKTTGPGWFDLPAPADAELPKLYREVEALRLRNQLDPKRFYRKEEGEGRGIKGLPKYFAIGTIIPESTPFGKASSDNLSRSQRKRTLVDELVDDAETKSYAKKKFKELQTVRGARGRGTLAQRQAKRKPKW